MTADSANPLEGHLAKLERRSSLPPEVRAAYLGLGGIIIRAKPHDVIVSEGDVSRHCIFVSSGFLSRQKTAGGAQKIVGLGIADDAVDLQSLWFQRQDHTLIAHKSTTLVAVPHDNIIDLCDQYPPLWKALWHDTLVDAAVFREWTLNIGHRRARLRMAHLFLEVEARQKAAGLIEGDVFELPLTQSELAGALGLSLVHLNKSLAVLRDQEYVSTDGRIVTLLNRGALEQETGFDPSYLHLTSSLRHSPAETNAMDGCARPSRDQTTRGN